MSILIFLWKNIKKFFIFIIKLILSVFCGSGLLLVFGFIVPKYVIYIFIVGFLISAFIIFSKKEIL